LLLAFGTACGGKSVRTGDSSAGGKSSVDGSGTIYLAACGSFDACGGDVVGTWTLSSLCSDGNTSIEHGLGPNCAVIDGTPTFTSDTSYTFDSDGTYTASGAINLSATQSPNRAAVSRTGPAQITPNACSSTAC
jgi:hypothetical protein